MSDQDDRNMNAIVIDQTKAMPGDEVDAIWDACRQEYLDARYRVQERFPHLDEDTVAAIMGTYAKGSFDEFLHRKAQRE